MKGYQYVPDARENPVDMFLCVGRAQTLFYGDSDARAPGMIIKNGASGHVETVCCLYHQKKDFISVPYELKDDGYMKHLK